MNKRVYIGCIIFLLLFIFSAGRSSFPSTAQNFLVVNEDGIFKVRSDITNTLVFASSDAATAIQWAIDNIGGQGVKGGEVLIEEGTYPLNNCLQVKDNVWLHGMGETTTLYANARIKSAILVQDATMAVISDISLVNKNNDLRSPIGIWIERSIGCQVINVSVSHFGRGLLHNGESSLTLINNNTFTDNETNIDIMNGGGVTGRWLPLIVSENVINGGETGIYCNALCTNIIKNSIAGLSGRGIIANANSIIVRENKITEVAGDFAIWGNGQEFNCTGNIITNVKGGGIRTRTRWGSVSQNTIMNCGSESEPAIGILIVSDEEAHEGIAESKVIYGNVIVNEEGYAPLEYGIKEDGLLNVIMKNKIKNVKVKPVLTEGKGTMVVPE